LCKAAYTRKQYQIRNEEIEFTHLKSFRRQRYLQFVCLKNADSESWLWFYFDLKKDKVLQSM